MNDMFPSVNPQTNLINSNLGPNINAHVFSTELAINNSTNAIMDALPLDNEDYLRRDMTEKDIPRKSKNRLTVKEIQKIQDRLRELGYLEEEELPRNVPLNFDAPPIEILRPTYRTAAVQGRIHLSKTELLVDSGSSISVVGLKFAQKQLR